MSEGQPIEGPIAVRFSQFQEYGCPYCGYEVGYVSMSGPGASIWVCSDCQRGVVVAHDEATHIPIHINGVEPKIVEHPRYGTPKHGPPDTYHDGRAQFNSRGLGLDHTPGCFVCGGDHDLYHNISGFVNTKSDGEHVVAMFQHGARLDYREYEPHWIQVKIGACEQHIPQLKELNRLCKDGEISEEIVEQATAYKP